MKQTTKRPTFKQRQEAQEYQISMAIFVAMMLLLLMIGGCNL